MLELLKSKNGIVMLLGVALVVFVYMNINSCNKNKEIVQNYENSIAALTNDSIEKITNKDGDTVFITQAATMSPKEIKNSELYKQLDVKTKKYVDELAKTKRLLASTKATIEIKDQIIHNLEYDSTVLVTDSNVIFDKGYKLLIKDIDTADNLDYTASITFNNIPEFKLDYKFNLDIQTDYTRDKKGGVKVVYKLDDDNANVISSKSFYIPKAEQTKWQKFIKSKPMKLIGSGVLFFGGFYAGVSLAN